MLGEDVECQSSGDPEVSRSTRGANEPGEIAKAMFKQNKITMYSGLQAQSKIPGTPHFYGRYIMSPKLHLHYIYESTHDPAS